MRATVVALALLAGVALANASPRCEGRLPGVQIQQQQEATLQLLRGQRYAALQAHMDGFLDAYSKGTLSDEELFYQFGAFDRWGPSLDPLLQEWVAQHPRSFAAHHAMAVYLAAVAWERRGSAYASETSARQFADFRRYLENSLEWGRRAAPLHPKPILSYQLLVRTARALPDGPLFAPLRADAPKTSTLTQTNRVLRDAARVLGANERLVGHWPGGRDIPPSDYARRLLDESYLVQADNIVVREAYIAQLEPKWGGSAPGLIAFARPEAHPGLPADRMDSVAYMSYLALGAYERWQQKQPENAVRYYELAAAKCRLDGAWLAIAEIRIAQGRWPEALKATERALEVYPSAYAAKLKEQALQNLQPRPRR